MSELFNGTWEIDLARSSVWDDATQRHVRDEVGQEVIKLHVEDGVQDYEVLYGDRPTIRMGYTSRYDDPEWVPYVVREIISGTASDDTDESVAEFKRRIKASRGERERHFEVGRAYALVRTIYVDPRTHYRVGKSAEDGSAQTMMLRRLDEDEKSYVATVLDANGVVYRIRTFVRI